MKENPLAVPGTWNPGTNYADSRYQLPQIDINTAKYRNRSFENIRRPLGEDQIEC